MDGPKAERNLRIEEGVKQSVEAQAQEIRKILNGLKERREALLSGLDELDRLRLQGGDNEEDRQEVIEGIREEVRKIEGDIARVEEMLEGVLGSVGSVTDMDIRSEEAKSGGMYVPGNRTRH